MMTDIDIKVFWLLDSAIKVLLSKMLSSHWKLTSYTEVYTAHLSQRNSPPFFNKTSTSSLPSSPKFLRPQVHNRIKLKLSPNASLKVSNLGNNCVQLTAWSRRTLDPDTWWLILHFASAYNTRRKKILIMLNISISYTSAEVIWYTVNCTASGHSGRPWIISKELAKLLQNKSGNEEMSTSYVFRFINSYSDLKERGELNHVFVWWMYNRLSQNYYCYIGRRLRLQSEILERA